MLGSVGKKYAKAAGQKVEELTLNALNEHAPVEQKTKEYRRKKSCTKSVVSEKHYSSASITSAKRTNSKAASTMWST